MKSRGMIGFLRVKIDDVTKEAAGIWGFEPVRDGLNTKGGMMRNAEKMIGFSASN